MPDTAKYMLIYKMPDDVMTQFW